MVSECPHWATAVDPRPTVASTFFIATTKTTECTQPISTKDSAAAGTNTNAADASAESFADAAAGATTYPNAVDTFAEFYYHADAAGTGAAACADAADADCPLLHGQ